MLHQKWTITAINEYMKSSIVVVFFFFIFECALMRLREPVRIHFGPYIYILISTLHLIATVKGNCQNHCKHCNHGMSFTSWLSDMNFESKWILIKRNATHEKRKQARLTCASPTKAHQLKNMMQKSFVRRREYH